MENNNNQNNNFIKLRTPHLLKIRRNEIEKKMISPGIEYNYQKENAILQNKINQLKEMDAQLKQEEYNYDLERLLTSFYKNPFCYMDYLVKKYFKEKGNALTNLKIKDEIINQFSSVCRQIEGKIQQYTNNEEKRLQNLERKINNKLRGIDNNIIHEDYKNYNNIIHEDYNNYNNIGMNNNKIQSEPLTNEELREYCFNLKKNDDNSKEDEKMKNLNNLLNSRPDAQNLIINDIGSGLHQEEIFNQVLACLKGDEIIPPKNSFLTTNDIDLNYMKNNPTLDSKRLFEIKEKTQFEGNKMKDPINQRDDQGIIKRKLFYTKEDEKKKFNKMINDVDNEINKMENIQKENEKIMGKVKENLDKEFEKNAIKLALTKLRVSEVNLDTYQNEINKAKLYPVTDLKERKNLMDEDYYNTQVRINNFLKGKNYKNNAPLTDQDIDKLYEKYGKKKSQKKKKIK